MTLHPIPSEFPYIWGKFCQCTHTSIYPLGNNKAISLVYISPNLQNILHSYYYSSSTSSTVLFLANLLFFLLPQLQYTLFYLMFTFTAIIFFFLHFTAILLYFLHFFYISSPFPVFFLLHNLRFFSNYIFFHFLCSFTSTILFSLSFALLSQQPTSASFNLLLQLLFFYLKNSLFFSAAILLFRIIRSSSLQLSFFGLLLWSYPSFAPVTLLL
jgi:hypothetical protein